MSPPVRVATELPSDGLKVEGGTLRAARALGFGAIASRPSPGMMGWSLSSCYILLF